MRRSAQRSPWPRVMVAVALCGTSIGLAACAAAPLTPPPEPTAEPSATAPPQTSLTAPSLAAFLGSDLTFDDHGSFGFDEARIVPDPDAPGGQFLRVSYPAGSASRRAAAGDGAGYGGTQAYLRWADGPVDVAHLRYQVRFMDGFEFVKGGKLPGLYGGTEVSGGKIPDGTNGFSTRYMWRRDGAGEVYAYLPSSKEHGTSLDRGAWTFVPGEWTAVEQEVRLNTPGTDDGSVTVWIDGAEALRETGIEFRTTDRLQIDGLFFSTFFGGGDSSWASPTDQYADFAEFAVSADPIGPFTTG